jgi:transposase
MARTTGHLGSTTIRRDWAQSSRIRGRGYLVRVQSASQEPRRNHQERPWDKRFNARIIGMSDFKLFRVSSAGVSELQAATLPLERSLQTLFEQNLDRLLGIRFLASEHRTTTGRIDTLQRFPPDLNRRDSQRVKDERVFVHCFSFAGGAMPKSYSGDLRERVIEAVESGASRRETAERFEVSVSSAVKWLQRWHESKSAAPKPRGGSVSPLEEFAERILDLIAEQPDLTLVETVAELRKRRIRTSRSSLWRFLDRHGITLKKGQLCT